MTKKIAHIFVLFLVFFGASTSAWAHNVSLEFDGSSPQISYAAKRIALALQESGHEITADPAESELHIRLTQSEKDLAPEEFATVRVGASLAVTGGDGRGVIYGALSIAEQLRNGTKLENLETASEEAALPFRAIKHNLPWDSYRSSSALDLHYDTVKTVKYWETFLDMMADNRFNALTLWNLHPFPYMIKAKNFPEATPLSRQELSEWRTLYQSIFSMAKERGIDTYLVNWNILVSPEFAAAHGLEGEHHFPNYKGIDEAETSELVKRYTRESVTQLLNEYPDLTGFGFSFGEQMAGMTPKERQDWMDEAIIEGMKKADRPSKMIFRAPFSADLGQGGSTDLATEELTRAAIEKMDSFDGPIWMEIKFNWSHGHSSPQLVKVHGGELKDTYFEPVPDNYRVAWMVRNEDFYALRWGSSRFIRDHLAQNSHQDYIGGYFIGSENYIPAVDYFTAVEEPVDWTYAFERQWLFYKLWGRLLYNPDTPDTVFEKDFVRRYGEAGRPMLKAYEHASQTELDFVSSIDFAWDFTVYGEGMMVLGQSGMKPMSVERLIVQPPLLPNWLSVKDFVAKREAGETIGTDVVSPLILADRMEANSREALALVREIDMNGDASLMYEVADVKIWAKLGLYYAEKLRGAVALQTYRTAGNEKEKQAAIDHLSQSLSFWDEVIAITRPIYKDMPLAHYNPPNNQRNDDNLFHWTLIRGPIADDIEIARKAQFLGP